MRYMFLIYENEATAANMTPDERNTMMSGYFAFSEEMRSSGKLEAGDPLMPTETSTTVRVKNGDAVHSDGPFTETKEQLGGYYILDCESLDEALACAAKIPTATTGCIEVRPIMSLDG